MWNIKEEILNGAGAVGIQVSELPSDECKLIRSAILSKYTDSPGVWPTWLWEHFTSAVSYADQDGWRWVGEFCSGTEAIMLFSETDEQAMFQFSDGCEVSEVLEECFGFEFHLTNRSVDFVICFNHHDCIVATGDAIAWIEEQRSRRGYGRNL